MILLAHFLVRNILGQSRVATQGVRQQEATPNIASFLLACRIQCRIWFLRVLRCSAFSFFLFSMLLILMSKRCK
jgi:hypothetical protein